MARNSHMVDRTSTYKMKFKIRIEVKLIARHGSVTFNHSGDPEFPDTRNPQKGDLVTDCVFEKDFAANALPRKDEKIVLTEMACCLDELIVHDIVHVSTDGILSPIVIIKWIKHVQSDLSQCQEQKPEMVTRIQMGNIDHRKVGFEKAFDLAGFKRVGFWSQMLKHS